jgi:hypothetical protein
MRPTISQASNVDEEIAITLMFRLLTNASDLD